MRNQDELNTYKPVLGADADEHVRWLAKLSDVRLQDILSWPIGP